MARNGSGTYVLPAGNPVVPNTVISSSQFNTTTTDIAQAITQSLSIDGQSTMSANLPMGSHRITGLADGVALTDAATVGQIGTGTLRTELAAPSGAGLVGTADGGTLALSLLSKLNRVVDSIAVLKTLDKTKYTRAFVTGYYAAGDGGGGAYWYDSTDTTTADNGGTIIVAADGGRWKLVWSDRVSLMTFGPKHDGTTDDTSTIAKAFDYAAGRLVYGVPGHFRITQNIDAVSTADVFRFQGVAPAYIPQTFVNPAYTAGSDFSPACINNIANIVAEHTVFQCDGCSLFGAEDTTGPATLKRTDKVKSLRNFVAYGKNTATIGMHWMPIDADIQDCTFALFSKFGILERPGTLSKMHRVGIVDCGYSLAPSGTIGYPNTYFSGCAYKILANNTPSDYTTINGALRSTTSDRISCFVWTRAYYVTNLSGYRGIQASGLLSATFLNWGGYTGNLMDTCEVTFPGCHFENYATGGAAAADGKPHAIHSLNCSMDMTGIYAVNINVPTSDAIYQDFLNSNVNLSNSVTRQTARGPDTGSPVRSTMKRSVTVIAAGTTKTYVIPNVFQSNNGFTGIVTASMVQESNYANYATKAVMLHRHTAGATQYAETPTSLHAFSTGAAGFVNSISAIRANTAGEIEVDVIWGASWSNSDAWTLQVGLIGAGCLSV